MIDKDIDRDGQFKLYIQIYGVIRRMIEEGEWQPNSMIPSEEELSKMFGVSKTTIRLALSVLSQEGYLRRQQGRGTFVKSPIPNSGLTMITRVSDSSYKDDICNEREVLESGICSYDEEIQQLLNIKGQIFYARCRNAKNNVPIYVEDLYVPLVYFQAIAEEVVSSPSFFDLIKKRSLRKIYRITQAIQIVSMKEVIASLLKTNTGSPALLMNKIFYDVEDKPIAYIRLYGSDKYRVETDLVTIR